MVIRVSPKLLGFAVLSVVALAAVPAHAATITVNSLADGADATAGDGVCETAAGNGVCTLRAAIQESNANGASNTINFSVTGTITVASNLPNITAELTIIGPNPAGSVIVSGGGSFSLLRYTGGTIGDYFVTNLTLQNGSSTGAPGAGLFFGPAAFSTLALTDVTVKDSDVTNSRGGGIAISASSQVTMTGGAVTGNAVTNGDGGGISNERGVLTLNNVTVRGNSAVNGGGIGLAGGTLTLTGSTISGNTATQDGGGLFLGVFTVVVPPSTTSSSAALENCTVAGNLATNGGGIGGSANNSAASRMVHCTVAGNFATATGGGGGIGLLAPGSSFPGSAAAPFTNNIVTDNFVSPSMSPPPSAPRSDCRQPFSHSDIDDSGFNIESATACGFGQTSDRQSVGTCTNALADRLGPTFTRGLTGGCIAANRALDRANTKWPTSTDQRGAPLADGDQAGGAQRDIGAYEFGAYGAVEIESPTYNPREDAGTVTIVVRRFGNLGTLNSVDFTTNSGCGTCTATEGDDFVPASAAGTPLWTPGDGGSKNIDVTIVDDDLVDDDATGDEIDDLFQVVISNLTKGADFGRTSTNVTIRNIENGFLQFSSTTGKTVCEATIALPSTCGSPTAEIGSTTFTVERVGVRAATDDPQGPPRHAEDSVSVTFETVAGVAIGAAGVCPNAADYKSESVTLTWAAGDDSDQTKTVTVCNDTEFEVNEMFSVQLTAPSAKARLGAASSVAVTIVSEDGAVPGSLQFTSASFPVNETAGTVTIMVERVGGNDTAVTVDYRTSATGAAQAGLDYSSRSGTLSWAAEDSAPKSFTVPITNDALREGAESFSVILSNPSDGNANAPNPSLGSPATATVTISSEDLMKFRFTQSSWTAIEGNPVTIFVEPTQPVVDGPFAIDYNTTDGTAGVADYATASGTLTFNNGETAAKSFTVTTAADALVEGNETFTVSLSTSNPVGEISAPATTTVTISEDDTGVQMAAQSASVAEGAGTLDVVVKRVGSSAGAVSVDYATVDGTAKVADGDYTAASGTLNWADGDTADKTIVLTIAGDALDEDNETLTVALSNPSVGMQLLSPSSQQITVTDDDATPSLSINSVSVAEGNSGTASLAFVVTLSAASGRTVNVDHVSANGSAAVGSDYVGIGGTLTFLPGETSKNTPVTVNGDVVDESNETLTVTLSNPSNASIGTAAGTGTINDDDAVTVSFSATAQTVSEGAVMATVTAIRNGASAFTITVPYTVSGSAAGASDHSAVNGNITIPSSASSGSYTFTVINDSRHEADETVIFTMATPTGGTVTAAAPTTHTVTITDNDFVTGGDQTPAIVVTVTGGNVNATSTSGGALPAPSLLGLLGLLALRRRRALALPLLAGVLLLPGVSLAQQPKAAGQEAAGTALSYRYAELRYVSASANDPDVNASGFSLAGSWLVRPDVFLTGSVAQAETDDFTAQAVNGSVKSTTLSAGAGWRRALDRRKDFTLSGALVRAKADGRGGFAGSTSETGFSVDAGLRGWFTPKAEWGMAASYLSIFDADSTSASAQALYHYSPRFALVLGAGLGDGSSQFNLGGRFGF